MTSTDTGDNESDRWRCVFVLRLVLDLRAVVGFGWLARNARLRAEASVFLN
jgi:hypothetical protein